MTERLSLQAEVLLQAQARWPNLWEVQELQDALVLLLQLLEPRATELSP